MQTISDYQKQAIPVFQPDQLVDVEGQIAFYAQRQDDALPMESMSAPDLKKHLAELRMYSELGVTEYLPLEPLSWRNEEGQPLFGIVDPMGKDNVFLISYTVDEGRSTFNVGGGTWPHRMWLPNEIYGMYTDMSKHLDSRRPKNWFGLRTDAWMSMRTQYKGLMPSDVLEKTNLAAKSGLFEKLYMFFEAPGWSYTAEPPAPLYRDPIVVGWAHHRPYVIADFEPLRAEQLWMNRSLPSGS